MKNIDDEARREEKLEKRRKSMMIDPTELLSAGTHFVKKDPAKKSDRKIHFKVDDNDFEVKYDDIIKEKKRRGSVRASLQTQFR